MEILVVYDSIYGNTEKIARAIGDAVAGPHDDVPGLHVGEAELGELESVELLFLGAPTHGAMPSEAAQALIDRLGAPAREGARVALFDTRLTWGFLKKSGFAADKMAEALADKGWTLAGEHGGFFVKGLRKGPLKRGEADHAAEWARGIVASQA